MNSGKRAEIIRLYQLGHTAQEIAAATGVHRATVYNNLAAAGVERRDDRLTAPGPPRKDQCQYGHRFTEKNTRVDANGSRHCKACETFRSVMRRYAGGD